MEKEKFHIIELPRPEITISEFGMSELLGGALCSVYTVCIGKEEYNGPQTYDPSKDCHGNTIGCEGGLFCDNFSQLCKDSLISTPCMNYCDRTYK